MRSLPFALTVALLHLGSVAATPLQRHVTAHFDFRFAAADRPLFESMFAHAERYRHQILADLGPLLIGRTIVVLAKDFEAFQRAAPTGVTLKRWMAGVAFARRNLVLIRTDGHLFAEMSKTFLHEYSHIALLRGVAHRPLPRWFVEGFATYQAGEWSRDKLERFLQAASTGQLIPLSELDSHFPAQHRELSLAYAQSVAFVGWLKRTQGSVAFQQLIQALLRGHRFDDALQIATGGLRLAELEKQWHGELKKLSSAYLWTKPELLWGLLSLLFLIAALGLYRRKKRTLAATSGEREPEIVYLDPPIS